MGKGKEGQNRGLLGRQQPDLEVPVCHVGIWILPWELLKYFKQGSNMVRYVFKKIVLGAVWKIKWRNKSRAKSPFRECSCTPVRHDHDLVRSQGGGNRNEENR